MSAVEAARAKLAAFDKSRGPGAPSLPAIEELRALLAELEPSPTIELAKKQGYREGYGQARADVLLAMDEATRMVHEAWDHPRACSPPGRPHARQDDDPSSDQQDRATTLDQEK